MVVDSMLWFIADQGIQHDAPPFTWQHCESMFPFKPLPSVAWHAPRFNCRPLSLLVSVCLSDVVSCVEQLPPSLPLVLLDVKPDLCRG